MLFFFFLSFFLINKLKWLNSIESCVFFMHVKASIFIIKSVTICIRIVGIISTLHNFSPLTSFSVCLKRNTHRSCHCVTPGLEPPNAHARRRSCLNGYFYSWKHFKSCFIVILKRLMITDSSINQCSY